MMSYKEEKMNSQMVNHNPFPVPADFIKEMGSPLFQMIMDNMPDLIWAKDMDNRYLFANRTTCGTLLMCENTKDPIGRDDIYFADRERARGFLHTFGEICIDSDQVTQQKKRTCRFVEEGFVRGNYLILDVHKAPLLDHDGRMVGTVGSARNITAEQAIEEKSMSGEETGAAGGRACLTNLSDRRVTEIALRESQNRFKTLFNGLNDAVFVHPFAEEGFRNFLEVNDVACEWYGYTREELLQMTPQDLILEPDGKGMGSGESRQALKRMGRRTLETLNRRKNNEIFPVEISSSLFEFHGKPMILSTVRDITDRRRSEKERADAVKFAAEQEKYALVGQVAGKMAHDFNNILSAIMGNAELSLMECENKEIRTSLETILEQTLRGKNLTRNLSAFALDNEPKETYFDINQKIDLVLSLMKKDLDGIDVNRRLSWDIPELLADPGMVEHALVNLLQNSIHATSLTLAPRIDISTRLSRGNLTIEIADNGCGIPEAYHDKIYIPSFTLKGSKDLRGVYADGIKGTGYGMANVKKYIQKHRGTIDFSSREGEGTRFILTIPMIQKDLTDTEKSRLTQKQVARGRKILLVEDEAAISGVQKKILGRPPFSHTVIPAGNGQEAIEAFDRATLDQDPFDLVTLDYILPGKLNGMDVYAHIRRTSPEVPVLFVSGNMGFIESLADLKAGDPVVDVLSKPCENMVFADTVNTWLTR